MRLPWRTGLDGKASAAGSADVATLDDIRPACAAFSRLTMGAILATLALWALLPGLPARADEPPVARPALWVDVAAHGDHAFFLRGRELLAFDFSDPLRPRELDALRLDRNARSVVAEAERLWVSVGSRGLVEIGTDEHGSLWSENEWDSYGKSAGIAPAAAGDLYVADGREGLRWLDRSQPRRPRFSTVARARGEVVDVAHDGKQLITAELAAGARLWRIERPGDVRRVADLRETQGARRVALAGGRIWIARGRRGLSVFELQRDGARPIAELTREHAVLDVLPAGETVILFLGGGGIEWVDAEQPQRSVARVQLPRGYPAYAGALEGSRLFVACGPAGFGLVSLEQPSAPEVLLPRDRRMKVRME